MTNFTKQVATKTFKTHCNRKRIKSRKEAYRSMRRTSICTTNDQKMETFKKLPKCKIIHKGKR